MSLCNLLLHPVVGLGLIFGDNFLSQLISQLLSLHRCDVLGLMDLQLLHKPLLRLDLALDSLLSLLNLVLDSLFLRVSPDRKVTTSTRSPQMTRHFFKHRAVCDLLRSEGIFELISLRKIIRAKDLILATRQG